MRFLIVGLRAPGRRRREFREIDLVSIRASLEAASSAAIEHFVYVSVAQPAPVMKVYQRVRAEGEALLREKLLGESGIPSVVLRPWYVLGEATTGRTC